MILMYRVWVAELYIDCDESRRYRILRFRLLMLLDEGVAGTAIPGCAWMSLQALTNNA